jgi:peptidoglycan/LPS O-acetylase OafA/YrhL
VIRCIAEFSLGLLAFRVASWPAAVNLASRPAVVVGLSGAIVVLLMMPGTDLPVVLLFPLLVLALAAGSGFLVRRMAGGLLYTLGVLSYSLYLLHFRFIWFERVLREHLPHSWTQDARQAIAAAVTFALLILCSVVTYTAIEKPCRKLLRSPLAIRLLGTLLQT